MSQLDAIIGLMAGDRIDQLGKQAAKGDTESEINQDRKKTI